MAEGHWLPVPRVSKGGAGRKDPPAEPEDKTSADSLRHRWGTRPRGQTARSTVGRKVPCHSKGKTPIKSSSLFLSLRARKGTRTPNIRTSTWPLLEVLNMTKYSQEGRVSSARFPYPAEWFSPGSLSAHLPFGLPPREWRIGARRRGAGPVSGARGRCV